MLPITANFFPASTIQSQELTKQGERWIRYDEIRFITKFGNFFTSKISVTLHILPFEVIYIDTPVPALVSFQYEYLTFHLCLGWVELRRFLLKQRGMIRRFIFFAIRR